MKKLFTFLFCFFTVYSVKAQTIQFLAEAGPNGYLKTILLAASLSNDIAKDINGNPMSIDTNGDGEIQISEALQVYELNIGSAQPPNDSYNVHYHTNGIEYFTNLSRLECNGYYGPYSLDVSKLTNLIYLRLEGKQTSLYVGSLPNLEELYSTGGGELIDCPKLKKTTIYGGYGHVKIINLPNLTELEYSAHKGLEHLEVRNLPKLISFNLGTNDQSFLGGNKYKITLADLPNLTHVYSGAASGGGVGNQLSNLSLTNLPKLTYLDCSNYELLTDLNLSELPNLTELYCNRRDIYIGYLGLGYLDISMFPKLIKLDCSNQNLTELNLSGLSNLTELNCSNNSLTHLDLSGLSNLEFLNTIFNSLTHLEVGNLTNLKFLAVKDNKLSSLDVSQNSLLESLNCSSNSLTSLDTSKNNRLKYLDCSANPELEELFIKNKSIETDLYFAANYNLRYICADEEQLSEVKFLIDDIYGYTNCTVTADCRDNLGTEEDIKANPLKVYVHPNPVKDMLHLHSKERIKEVKIFDLNGRLIKTESVADKEFTSLPCFLIRKIKQVPSLSRSKDSLI